MGGSGGIGKITLQNIAELGFDFKAYVVGKEELEEKYIPFIEDVEWANLKRKLYWWKARSRFWQK